MVIFLMRVVGKSMEPTLNDGQYVLASSIPFLWSPPKIGDVVVARHNGVSKDLIKRIGRIKDKRYYLLGDNRKMSTDSRRFGWVDEKRIIGKVILF